MGIPSNLVTPESNLYQFLDTDGDGSGTINAVGDYGTPDDFYIQPPSNKIYQLTRLIINIQSGSVLATNKYGSLAALSNGIKAIIESAGTEILLNKEAILTHDDWAGICHDSMALNYGSVAGKSISIRWTFAKSGANIWLNGATSDKFIIRLADDLQGLSKHRFFIQGVKHNV